MQRRHLFFIFLTASVLLFIFSGCTGSQVAGYITLVSEDEIAGGGVWLDNEYQGVDLEGNGSVTLYNVTFGAHHLGIGYNNAIDYGTIYVTHTGQTFYLNGQGQVHE